MPISSFDNVYAIYMSIKGALQGQFKGDSTALNRASWYDVVRLALPTAASPGGGTTNEIRIGAANALNVSNVKEIQAGGAKAPNVSGGQTTMIGSAKSPNVSGGQTTLVGDAMAPNVSGRQTTQVGGAKAPNVSGGQTSGTPLQDIALDCDSNNIVAQRDASASGKRSY